MAAASRSNRSPVEPWREPVVGLVDRAGERQQDVVADALERPRGVLVRVAPGVVDVQRGAVVDEPGPAVPDEQVRVGRRPVGFVDERVEPHDVRGDRRDRRRARRPGLKVSAPGRKSSPRFRPPLRWTRSWISSSGSASPRLPGRPRRRRGPGTGSPSARPISPASHSATSARGPWPAPRNFTTYRPSSSASTRPGSEPPSRSGVT